MLTRTVNGTTYTQVFDEENRLESVAVNGQTTYFYYDADGNRILTIYGAGASQVKVYTPFPDFEETITASGSTTQRTSYTLAGQLIAVRVRVGTTGDGTLRYAYTDHLGNVAALSYTGGTLVPNSLARYDPFGAFTTPPTTNPSITNHGFTGHRHNNTGTYDIELIYMNARYYMPEIGRFISADTIVPEPGNPQSYNRYAYVNNGPLNYTDPSGHCLQYAGEHGDSSQLLDCLYAWNRLGEHYASLGDVSSYPAEYMSYLLETATTDELVSVLAGFGIEYQVSQGQGQPAGDNGAYVAGSFSAGIGVNGKVTLIIDKYGNVYVALGAEIGIKGISGSITHGWVQQGYSALDLEVVTVDEEQLENLLTGWAMSGGGGAGVGVSFVGPFGEANEGYALTEAGVYYPPQVGAGGSYSFMIHNANARPERGREPTLLNSRFDYWYWYHFSR